MSPCPDEDALMRFADGVPDPALARHVEACGACRAAVVMLASMHADAAPPDEPSLLGGRFALGETLGTGGMGLVMAARDTRLGVDVAIKLLRPDRPRSDERLDEEVRTARRIRHPNVCAVFDLGHHGDRRFITMERVDGLPLGPWVAEAQPAFARRRDILRQIVDGVAAAHGHDVVHRDLKPGNVMVDGDGRAKVMDFGLAIDARAGAGEGQVGTPAWWAPEQRRGQPATARSDVYALGALAHWLLPEARGRLRRWISTCRAEDPAARFQDAEAARRALPTVRLRRRRRWLVAAALGIALSLGGWWASRPPRPNAAAASAFEAGQDALRRHQVSQAADALAEATRLDPSFTEAHLWLAYAYQWRGDTPGARRSIDEVLLHIERLTADDRLFALAIEARLGHEVDRATALLTRLLDRRPDHFAARLTRADLDFHRGRFAESGDAFAEYVALDPGAGQAWHHLAWARFATGGLDAAQPVTERWRQAGTTPAQAERSAVTMQVAAGPSDAAARAAEVLRIHQPSQPLLAALVALDRGDAERAYALMTSHVRPGTRPGVSLSRWQSWIALGDQRFDRAAAYARRAREAIAARQAGAAAEQSLPWNERQQLAEIRAEQIWARVVSGAPLDDDEAALVTLAASDDMLAARYASLAIALACLTLDDRPCIEAAAASGWPIVHTIDRAHRHLRMGQPARAAEIMREAAQRTSPLHQPALWLAASHLAGLANDPRAAADDLAAASRYLLPTPYSIVARTLARRAQAL